MVEYKLVGATLGEIDQLVNQAARDGWIVRAAYSVTGDSYHYVWMVKDVD